MKKNEQTILNAFNEMMEGKRGPLSPVAFMEAADDDKGGKTQKEEELTMDFGGEADDDDEEGKKKKKEKKEGKDDMDEADDILKNIDLKSMSNDAKVELISNVIQVLQDSVENDDEFSEYMNQILEVIDGYKFEKEGDEEEKEAKKAKKKAKKDEEEVTPEGGEVLPEMPEEKPEKEEK